ncbi:unnamed protein product [Alternaria alternata]|nr:hypothetical protein AALT_g10016 [Alternaria alternata]
MSAHSGKSLKLDTVELVLFFSPLATHTPSLPLIMYLPLNTVITATSLLAISQSNDLNLATNNLPLSASSVTLIARQDEAKPPPPPLVTSIQFVTSIALITSEPTPTVTVTSTKPDILSPPPTVPSTTAETRTSSEQPPIKLSTTELSSPNSSTTDGISSTTSAGTSASTATTVPTQTSHPEANAGPWLSAGKIAGIVVGSVFGLIILGLIIYTLLAASRGINVCDCFGGCCGKHHDDDENGRERLPSRSDDTYPRPDVLHSGPGEGYNAYRPARPSGDNPPVPLPLVLPQQMETQQRRAGRLQRGYRGVEV